MQTKKVPSSWKVTFVLSAVTSAYLFKPLENFFTAGNTLASPSGRPSGVSVGEKKIQRHKKRPRLQPRNEITIPYLRYYKESLWGMDPHSDFHFFVPHLQVRKRFPFRTWVRKSSFSYRCEEQATETAAPTLYIHAYAIRYATCGP